MAIGVFFFIMFKTNMELELYTIYFMDLLLICDLYMVRVPHQKYFI